MSLVARSLLVLAFASLLHAWADRDWHPIMGPIYQGILDDKHSQRNELPAIVVTPKNQTNFIFHIPNSAKGNQSLIGQTVFSASGDANLVLLEPLDKNKHSPIRARCIPRCRYLYVAADQFVIPTLA